MATKLPKPETGKTPQKITTKNPPGGSQTPGAKAAEAQRAVDKAFRGK
jgi:hypothetical protein